MRAVLCRCSHKRGSRIFYFGVVGASCSLRLDIDNKELWLLVDCTLASLNTTPWQVRQGRCRQLVPLKGNGGGDWCWERGGRASPDPPGLAWDLRALTSSFSAAISFKAKDRAVSMGVCGELGENISSLCGWHWSRRGDSVSSDGSLEGLLLLLSPDAYTRHNAWCEWLERSMANDSTIPYNVTQNNMFILPVHGQSFLVHEDSAVRRTPLCRQQSDTWHTLAHLSDEPPTMIEWYNARKLNQKDSRTTT